MAFIERFLKHNSSESLLIGCALLKNRIFRNKYCRYKGTI